MSALDGVIKGDGVCASQTDTPPYRASSYKSRYGYLDTDTIGTRDVFNAADNTIFAMNREVFSSELTAEYLTLESAGAFDMEAFADFCDEYQSYACESLWVEDFRREDMRTYTEMGTSAYLPMAHGKKRLQRRNFCTFQRAFMSSYFQSSYCTSDSATIRGYTPSSYSGVEPGSWMTITSYCDIFINVRAGSTDTQVRAYAGEAVTVELGVASMNDTEIYVRNAGFMQDLGPLAQLYPGYFDASNLTRIKRSEVGSDEDGYSNTNFTGASYTNCAALEYVNHMGCPNDNESMDFSPNVHLKELYTTGTNVTGVTFAKNGRVEIAQLNAVASLYMVGLHQLVSMILEDYTNLDFSVSYKLLRILRGNPGLIPHRIQHLPNPPLHPVQLAPPVPSAGRIGCLSFDR